MTLIIRRAHVCLLGPHRGVTHSDNVTGFVPTAVTDGLLLFSIFSILASLLTCFLIHSWDPLLPFFPAVQWASGTHRRLIRRSKRSRTFIMSRIFRSKLIMSRVFFFWLTCSSRTQAAPAESGDESTRLPQPDCPCRTGAMIKGGNRASRKQKIKQELKF